MIETQLEIETPSERAELPSEIGAAKQLADVVRQFEKERTGRMPESVTAELVDVSLVITLHGECHVFFLIVAIFDGYCHIQAHFWRQAIAHRRSVRRFI